MKYSEAITIGAEMVYDFKKRYPYNNYRIYSLICDINGYFTCIRSNDLDRVNVYGPIQTDFSVLEFNYGILTFVSNYDNIVHWELYDENSFWIVHKFIIRHIKLRPIIRKILENKKEENSIISIKQIEKLKVYLDNYYNATELGITSLLE